MRVWLRDLMDRYDQLTLRERALILGAMLALIVLAWDSFLMRPTERARKARLQQVQALRAEVSGLEKSTDTLVQQASLDPDLETRRELQALQAEITQIDNKLAGATSGLIAPKEMPRVLEQLLARSSELQLRSLRTLPPEPVVPASAGSRPGAPAVPMAQIYKHGLELELAGSYLEVLHFLQALEALPWRFFWVRIEFTVEQHPQGRLRLTLYTLGLQEGWIGV